MNLLCSCTAAFLLHSWLLHEPKQLQLECHITHLSQLSFLCVNITSPQVVKWHLWAITPCASKTLISTALMVIIAASMRSHPLWARRDIDTVIEWFWLQFLFHIAYFRISHDAALVFTIEFVRIFDTVKRATASGPLHCCLLMENPPGIGIINNTGTNVLHHYHCGLP